VPTAVLDADVRVEQAAVLVLGVARQVAVAGVDHLEAVPLLGWSSGLRPDCAEGPRLVSVAVKVREAIKRIEAAGWELAALAEAIARLRGYWRHPRASRARDA
jgi:hypothetical protein